MSTHNTAFVLILAVASATACADRAAESGSEPEAELPAETARVCAAPEVRTVVEALGEQMRQVSLLAPDTIVSRALEDAYAPLVTSSLLARWLANPGTAPGRTVSSPWPERIEIQSVEAAGASTCRVEGVVVYVASAAGTSSAEDVARAPAIIDLVQQEGAWRVDAYSAERAGAPATPADTTSSDATPPDAASADAAAAVAVLERYYTAIDEGEYRAAYALWSDGGATSGQTFDEFAAGYAETADAAVEPGTPGRIEGAAGSRYVVIPVVVHATTVDGTRQRYKGGYTLRRSVVDGATSEQRSWRIYSAEVVESNEPR